MVSNSDPKQKVLFMCTGNSCRSQMAEAIVSHSLGHAWIASSAGTKPAGFVHAMAIRVLNEIGIHHDGESKHVDVYRDERFDLVITVCDSAAANCPLWLGQGELIHISFPDPARAQGSEVYVLSEFRKVLKNMQDKIVPLLSVHKLSRQ